MADRLYCFLIFFRYGLREIYVGGDDKVIISLKYRPKNTTLSKKFGSLPIRYLLFTKKIDQESFGILEGLIRQYKFNCAN